MTYFDDAIGARSLLSNQMQDCRPGKDQVLQEVRRPVYRISSDNGPFNMLNIGRRNTGSHTSSMSSILRASQDEPPEQRRYASRSPGTFRENMLPENTQDTRQFNSPRLSPQFIRNPSPLISPVQTIDWTDPVKRRRTYEQYDKSRRGLRGVIRRITPRWLQSKTVEFYNGDSDAGSVRRYRLHVDNDEESSPAEEVSTEGRRISGQSHRSRQVYSKPLRLSRSRSNWSCFGGGTETEKSSEKAQDLISFRET